MVNMNTKKFKWREKNTYSTARKRSFNETSNHLELLFVLNLGKNYFALVK